MQTEEPELVRTSYLQSLVPKQLHLAERDHYLLAALMLPTTASVAAVAWLVVPEFAVVIAVLEVVKLDLGLKELGWVL